MKRQSSNCRISASWKSLLKLPVIVVVTLVLALVSACVPEPAGPEDPGVGTTPQEAALIRASNYLESRFTFAGYIESDFVSSVPEYNNTLVAVTNMAALGRGGSQLAMRVEWLKAGMESYINVGTGDRPGALGRLIMAAVALGEDPHDFDGVNLVERLEATQQPNGLYGAQSPLFDGTFRQGISLAALSLVTPRPSTITPVPGQSIGDLPAVKWLLERQCYDGSWMMSCDNLGADCIEVPSQFRFKDSNGTALAVLGLRAVGASPNISPLAWFDGVRGNDGGWATSPSGPTRDSDANSTGLVVAAINASGRVVTTSEYEALLDFQLGADDPVGYRGGFFWQVGDREPNVLATLDAMTGLFAEPWPQVLR